MNKDKIIEKLKKCPRFNSCSSNICPIDIDANLRNKLPEENVCPFCLKKKAMFQKGIKTLAPVDILKLIPKSNIKLINKRNQRRWYTLNK